MVEIATTRSRCVLRAFPYTQRITRFDLSPLKSDLNELLNTQETIIDSGILSCSITRDKGNFAASFTVTLKLTRNYTSLLKPGDWIFIYLDQADQIDYTNGTNSGLKIIGNIDRVSTSKVVDDKGTIIRTCRIDGRDVGKIFEKTQLFYNPYDPESFQQYTVLCTGLIMSGTPKDFISKYLNLFLGGGIAEVENAYNKPLLFQMLLPPKVFRALKGDDRAKVSVTAFYDILKKELDDVVGYSIGRDVGKNLCTSIGELIHQACNPAVNEVYLDTKYRSGALVPVLTLRQIPMTKDELVNLAKRGREITEKNIIVDDLGFSDHERYNYLILRDAQNLMPNLSFLANATSQKLPAITIDSIQRYGMNRVDRMSEYAISKTNNLIDFDTIGKWGLRLANYWFNYHRYETGTIVVHNLSHFEIGEMIKVTDRDRMYLVEGYAIEWNYLEAITTSLQVTHGMKLNGSFIEEKEDTPNVERPNNTSFVPERGVVDPAGNKLEIEKD